MIYCKFLSLESIYYFCEIDYIFKLEQWMPILGYEGIYEISDLGRVKSLNRVKMHKNIYPIMSKEKILKQTKNTHGYLTVGLYSEKRKITKVHKIMSSVFMLNEKNLVVNHKDFNRLNNKKINLELISQRENSNKQHIKSRSRYLGVCWNKNVNKWKSQIVINKKQVNLGSFNTELEASNAYQKALNNIT